MPKSINIMITCIGRRVSLLEAFKAAGKDIGCAVRIVGTDTTNFSSALQLCSSKKIVCPVRDPEYIDQVLDIVKKEKVHMLVPTVDLDLKVLAENTGRFEELGCKVFISRPEIIDICQDKRNTFRFLRTYGFDTPATLTRKEISAKKRFSYPLFLKPWDGYASRGNAVVNNRKELEFYQKHIPNCIAQEYIRGEEFTCDVYVDFNMKIRCVVPRKRIEVRSGEVSKALVVKDLKIMDFAAQAVNCLGAGPGVITLQLIKTEKGKLKIIEINPRFGGGAPLSIKAGANFPKWIIQEYLGRNPRIKFDGFRDKLVMLRYDSEVWYNIK